MKTTNTENAVNFKKLDKLAWWLDNSIRVPGTNWRVGFDGIIGLIPGIGDLTAGALSSYIILQAVRMGIAPMVIARMVLNVALETIVGVIPVVGDIFDFAFKANKRNTDLMRAYLQTPDRVKQRSTFTVVLVAIAVIAAIILIIWAAISLLVWLVQSI